MRLELMTDQAAPGVGEWKGAGDSEETKGVRSVQVGVLGTGVVGATIRIYGANDGRFPILLTTFVVSGQGDGSCTEATDLTFPFEQYRAELVSINGVAARASVTMRV